MKPIAMRSPPILSLPVAIVRTAPPRRTLLVSALAAAMVAPLLNTPARADAAWPNRTVRLVTLAAAGAGTDAIARILAEALNRRWGQPVVVDNRPGGDGIVSIETFLAAREGNHTLLFDATRDLIPLAFVAQDFIALAASPRLDAATLAEVVAAARARPGTLTWSCAPSVPFLAFTSFLKVAGLELTYVPYRNPIASLPDLAEGRVDLAFLPLAPMVGPAQAGKIRLIAVASDDRAPGAPDVPTAKEAGFPALSVFGGHSLFGPKEMPEALRTRISADIREVTADVAQRLRAMGYISRASSPAEFTAILDRERAHWTDVAQKY